MHLSRDTMGSNAQYSVYVYVGCCYGVGQIWQQDGKHSLMVCQTSYKMPIVNLGLLTSITANM